MLELKHIQKRYQYQKVLDDINIIFPKIGFIAIVGPSGCGKSTLLHIIGGIDKDFKGELLYNEKKVSRKLTKYRQHHVSYIFQQFHLVMWLSVHQNIALSNFFKPQRLHDQQIDISEFNQQKMSSLSSGQRQRIAYLRAQYQQSDILLCDEPTGALDSVNANEVMKLLKTESKKRLIIYVSHDIKLVEKYSDQIYEMQDGKIINHKMIHECLYKESYNKTKKRIWFSKFRISIMSLLSHKARSMQLIFGLMLSLVCIVLTLTMSQSLEKQIHQYIYSMISDSSISFQAKNHSSLSFSMINDIKSLTSISRVQMYLDDYELLGIGFQKDKYQESETLFIGDDSLPYQDLILKEGQFPKSVDEIVVSLSTAKHLCKDDYVFSLINQKISAWYQHENTVKAIEYKIVGITNNTTVMDTLYQQENAYVGLLKKIYDIPEIKASMGIIYVDKEYERSDIIKQLNQKFPEYKYVEVGTSTLNNVSTTMKQVKIILSVFSVLAILSSLFLIGEVMFLNVVQKRKDLSIMKCFGATTFDLLRIVFYESLEIVIIAQIMATLMYKEMIDLVNIFVKESLFNETIVFEFNYQLLLIIYALSFCLVFLSQVAPLVYVMKMNTIEALKQ